MKNKLEATVIITTYDRYDLVSGAINSVLQQDIDKSCFEIVVVDNCPDPEKHEHLKSVFKASENVRIIKEEHKGLSMARNAGIKASRAPVICFVDDDALAQHNWLSEILKAFARYGEKAGIVGGTITPKWTGPVPSWIDKRHLNHLSIISWGGRMRVAGENEWFAGCNIAFNKRDLIAAGGFNTQLGRSGNDAVLLSNDESEVVLRIQKSGKLRVYAPRAIVQHIIDPNRLTHAWFRRRVAWQAVSDFVMDAEEATRYSIIAAERTRNRLVNPGRQNILSRWLAKLRKPTRQSDENPDIGYPYDIIMALLSGEDILPPSATASKRQNADNQA